MSKYTTTIKVLIDNNFDFQLTSYPIFDESHRSTLNQKILDHYYMSEIGFETAALFRHYLKSKLNDIMPKYNVMYAEQAAAIANMGNNVNITETMDRDTTKTESVDTDTSGSSSSTSNSSTSGKNLFQDTPQGAIPTTDIDAQNVYATNVTKENGTSNATDSTSTSGSAETTTTGSGTDEYTKTIVGNNGKTYRIDNYIKLKAAYSNIDLEIINELSDLFMGVL